MLNQTNQRALRAQLVEWVRSATRLIIEQPTLVAIQTGALTQEQWIFFAKQRFLAAEAFETLLETGKAHADTANDILLAQVLEKNLNDERGIIDGTLQTERAHSTWRRDFYRAIGVSEQAVQTATPTVGTKAYIQTLTSLIQDADYLKIAGAVLAIEGSLSSEFQKLQAGRDKTFPNLNAKARLYIDDHILHDASSHYPDLLKALDRYIESKDTAKRIHEGITQITNAKTSFYRALENL